MNYIVNFGTGVINIPRDGVLDKLATAGERELKFLIRFMADEDLRSNYEECADNVATELSLSRAAIDAALSYWQGAGVITSKEGTAKKKKVARFATLPSYSGEEISKIVNENGLSEIIDECQRLTGKIFNNTEINRIAALNSYLGLESDYILLLFSYCAARGKCALKYIEKAAYDLSDRGINTTDKLELFIKLEDEKRSLEGKLRTMFGFGDRELTPTEKKYFSTWADLGYNEDVIREAFNITVEKAGKLSLHYLNKILLNWKEKGLNTLEDVQRATEEYKQKKEDKKASDSKESFDVNEFFELSLKRSREKMQNS